MDRATDGRASLRLGPFATIGATHRRALEDEAERLVRYLAADAPSHGVDWAR